MQCQSKSYTTNSPTSRNQSSQAGIQQHHQLDQYSPNLIISHLNADNTFGECSTPIDPNSSTAHSQHYNNSGSHQQTARINLSPYEIPYNRQSTGSDSNSQGLSVGCSSVDRVASQNSCCSPLEIHYDKNGQQMLREQEHRMTINRDSLTLVIVDCSPSPAYGDCSVSQGGGVRVSSAQSEGENSRAPPVRATPVYSPTSASRNEHSPQCNHSYTTQLIVRQHHHASPEHYHCPNTSSMVNDGSTSAPPPPLNYQQQPQKPLLSIEASPGRGYREETEETTRITTEETTKQRQINKQHQSEANYLYPSRSPNYFQPEATESRYQEKPIDNNSPYSLAQEPQYHTNPNQTLDRAHQQYIMEQTNMSSSHPEPTTTTMTQSSREDASTDPIELHSGQNKHNLVKRWDWNRQEFVYSEPQSHRKQAPLNRAPQQPPPPAASGISRQEVDENESESVTQVQTKTIEENYEERSWQEPHPSTSSTSPQITRYEPTWLAYKVPDMESMRTDPLYSDLMYEIKCLEDTMKPKEPAIVDGEGIEEFHKPVFGQSMTPDYIEVNEYENAEFVCRLIPNADPSMSVQWTVNGQPLKDSSRYTCEYDFGVVRLKIKRCESEDSGIYQCRASNSLGEAITTGSLKVHAKGSIQCESLHPAGLDKIRALENPPAVDQIEEQKSEQPPKFITHIQDYVEKSEGESVHFECCLNPVDDPDLKTEWFFNGRPLVTGSRFHTIDDFGFIVLDIDWLFPRDTGEYVCRATNKHGTDVTRSVLRVKPDKNIVLDSQLDNPLLIDKLRQLEFPDVEQQVEEETPNRPAHFVQHLATDGQARQYVEGDNVHFEARVAPANDGTLQLEWFHNDKPLASGHRFKPTFDFGHIQLDILYVYAEDSGVYKCVARNGSGQDVSQFEIRVTGKPSLVYQCQLPKEMEGGVQKITDMEAQWNKPPEEEDEPEEAVRTAPVFVLTPKPCTAFEGSCARFCCRVSGTPRPRLVWTLNGQIVVSGSRHKLTYDGMHHLTIPKCQLSDAGKLEVHARNPMGECYASTKLLVKRKVDDYRGVLKNSPNPWYDEQSLKVYQRQRSQETDDDEDIFYNLMKKNSTNELSGNQVVGYMEPNTPDVNLLLQSQPPLFPAADLHPVVFEQQSVKAPAPSTIQRAMVSKDKIKVPDRSLHITPDSRERFHTPASFREPQESEERYFTEQQQPKQLHQAPQSMEQQDNSQQHLTQTQRQKQQQHLQQDMISQSGASAESGRNQQASDYQSRSVARHQQQQQHQLARRHIEADVESQSGRSDVRGFGENYDNQIEQRMTVSSLSSDSRLPPPSPSQDATKGKEVQSLIYKQTQRERRSDREIVREIIEKETFEQEHKGITKENVVRGSSLERTPTPTLSRADIYQQQQHQQVRQQQQSQRQVHFQQEVELVEELMTPPEFIQKIQPCQAFEGDEALFECTYTGDPAPTITWFRESKQVKPSNLYQITSDETKSKLVIKRVTLNSNAVFTVRAENCAGLARSSANLVVEPHPFPMMRTPAQGLVRNVPVTDPVLASRADSPAKWSYQASSSSSTGQLVGAASSQQLSGEFAGSQDSLNGKIIKSVKTRTLGDGQISHLIRPSAEGLVAPTFMHPIHDAQCRLGELARFDARLVGSQPVEFRWLKDGDRIRADKSHKMVLEGDLYTLLILEVSARDEGLYECVASNVVGEARCEARLTIGSGLDMVDSTSGSYEFASTSVSTRSSQQQQQLRQTHTSGGNSSTTTSLEQSSSKEKEAPQQRQYFGLQRHQYNPLLSQYSPSTGSPEEGRQQVAPKLIKKLENQQVIEGKSVTLRCQISSYPQAEVHWYKGDQLIKASKYFRIFKDNDETYCLKILETFPEDQGEYRCIARASNGRTETRVVETRAHISVIALSPK